MSTCPGPMWRPCLGAGYQLNRVKDLSQPGQFACAERVTLEGPKGPAANVVILGPERPESQVEISLTDAVALGLTPPVRLSGDITDPRPHPPPRGPGAQPAPGADRGQAAHSHDPGGCRALGVVEQNVRLGALPTAAGVRGRGGAGFPKFSTVVHIDYDEANACGFQKGDRGLLLL